MTSSNQQWCGDDQPHEAHLWSDVVCPGRDAATRPYWYFISVWVCPICGNEETIRERRYDERPEDPSERREYIERWDYCNAL